MCAVIDFFLTEPEINIINLNMIYHTSIKRQRRWEYPSGASVVLRPEVPFAAHRAAFRFFFPIFSPFGGSSLDIWQRRWHLAAAQWPFRSGACCAAGIILPYSPVLLRYVSNFEPFLPPLNLLQNQKKILRLFLRYIGTTRSQQAVKKHFVP